MRTLAGTLAAIAVLTISTFATASSARSASVRLTPRQLARTRTLVHQDRSVKLRPTLLNRLSRGRRGHVVATTRVDGEKVHASTFKVRRRTGGRTGAELYAQHQLGAGASGYAPLTDAEATSLREELLEVAGLGMLARPSMVFTGVTASMTGFALIGQAVDPYVLTMSHGAMRIAGIVLMHAAAVVATVAVLPMAMTAEPMYIDANSKKALGRQRALIDWRTVTPPVGGGA